jgi:hypothetical protein
MTWAPGIWILIGETFALRTRAKQAALSTASNWLWNFLLAFFTPFITGDIGYAYGFVFAGCNLAGAVIVYFFLYESSGLSLESVDQVSHASKNEIQAPEDLHLTTFFRCTMTLHASHGRLVSGRQQATARAATLSSKRAPPRHTSHLHSPVQEPRRRGRRRLIPTRTARPLPPTQRAGARLLTQHVHQCSMPRMAIACEQRTA